MTRVGLAVTPCWVVNDQSHTVNFLRSTTLKWFTPSSENFKNVISLIDCDHSLCLSSISTFHSMRFFCQFRTGSSFSTSEFLSCVIHAPTIVTWAEVAQSHIDKQINTEVSKPINRVRTVEGICRYFQMESNVLALQPIATFINADNIATSATKTTRPSHRRKK